MIKPRCPIADFKLSICLFGAVKLNKNADLIKMYILVMVSDSLDACSQFLLRDGRWGKSMVIFGAGMSSFVLVGN